jgi:NAD(P)-dependent dehydrogenase (short-subunit alcohol dehydrogenase family)
VQDHQVDQVLAESWVTERRAARRRAPISSVRAVTIEPGLAVYGSTKAAIGPLVKGFVSEVGRFGVRVNTIAPSIAETALTEQFKHRPDIQKLYPYRVRSLERGRRSRVRRRFSGLRCGELREREHNVRRRRLDRDRWAADRPDATGAMTGEPPDHGARRSP